MRPFCFLVLGTDAPRVAGQEVAGAAGGVVGIGHCAGRRAGIDRLTAQAAEPTATLALAAVAAVSAAIWAAIWAARRVAAGFITTTALARLRAVGAVTARSVDQRLLVPQKTVAALAATRGQAQQGHRQENKRNGSHDVGFLSTGNWATLEEVNAGTLLKMDIGRLFCEVQKIVKTLPPGTTGATRPKPPPEGVLNETSSLLQGTWTTIPPFGRVQGPWLRRSSSSSG